MGIHITVVYAGLVRVLGKFFPRQGTPETVINLSLPPSS